MNIDRFAYPNLKIPIAVVVGLFFAIVFGLWAGGGEFARLKLAGAVATGVIFILFFLRHMWVIGLLICFCAFFHVGFGFTMGEVEMSLVLAGVFFAMTWWRKKKLERPPILDNWSFGLLNTLLLLWLIYVFGHTVFNIYDPYRPADFALKNLLKTVEAWVGPILVLTYFANRPHYIEIQRDFPRRIAWCLLVALCINIAIRLYQQVTGAYNPVSDPNDPFAADYFTIPIVNLMENVYALRAITPTAMLFCGAFLVTRWFKEQPLKDRRLFYIVMALSIVGSVLSGGRATLAFVVAVFAVFLVIQRRIGLLIGFCACIGLLVGLANLLPGVFKSSPSFVRRSLNWALVEKDTDVSGDIASSSNWRLSLFNRALDEWHSDPRIYWFGRATYSYGVDDMIAVRIYGDDAPIESALRRGATHNMLTDLLVTFGLVGLILFFSAYLTLLYFLWTLYRNRRLDELARTLTLVMLVSLAFHLAYAVLGGGNFPMTQSWFFIILIAYLYKLHAEAQRTTQSTKIEPPKARQFAPTKPGGALPAGA